MSEASAHQLNEARAPSAALLLAVARELADLERAGAMLQDLVAGRVKAGALSGTALLDAQDADLLVQHLAELARFLKVYGEALQANAQDPLADALNSLLLSALGSRLAPERARVAPDQAVGALEMF